MRIEGCRSKWVSGGTYYTTNNTYYDTGAVSASTDPKGNPTTFTYSAGCAPQGPITVQNALQQVSRYSYEGNTGLLTSITDPNQQTTSFTQYDNMWRLESVTYPDGGQASISYTDGASSQSVLTQTMGASESKITTRDFDGLGRVILKDVSDPAGDDLVNTTYDALGNVASVTNPHRAGSNPTDGTTYYYYDALNRPAQTTQPDGSKVLTSYAGGATEVQDEGNGTNSVTRISQADGLGRMTSVCEVSSTALTGLGGTPSSCGQDMAATGFLTQYSYDALDDLLQVAQNGLNSRTFGYDGLGRLTGATNPESGAATYNYDADNNVTSKVSPLPNESNEGDRLTTTYNYDAINRLTNKTYSDGFTPGISYVYDTSPLNGVTLLNPIGRLVRVTADNGNSIIWNSYDQMGRVVTQWQYTFLNHNKFNGHAFVFSYLYDYLGDMTSQTNGQGVTLTIPYDDAQHLTSVTSSMNDSNHPPQLFQPGLGGTQYDPGGQLDSAIMGNGLTETNAYDNRMRLTSETVGPSGSAYSLALSYAPNGDVLTANDSANGDWAYTYDDFNRMITSSESSPDNAYSYGYDRFGNRWSQTLTEGEGYNSSVTFDANNHITSGSVGTDIAGNVDIADTGSGFADTFIYFADNNIDYVYGNGAYQAYYHYDGLGRRTEKIAGSSTNYYYYDLAGHEIAVMDQNGNWIRGEVYAGGKHIATYVGGATGATYFDHADQVGTERARTSTPTTGSPCETIASLPFGDGQTITGSCGDPTPMHFTGKERDAESNLDNFGARYYSNTFGRWMSADWADMPVPVPYADLTNPQSLNLYSYVSNNPINRADANGHCGGGPNDPPCSNVRVTAEITQKPAVERNVTIKDIDGTVIAKATGIGGKLVDTVTANGKAQPGVRVTEQNRSTDTVNGKEMSSRLVEGKANTNENGQFGDSIGSFKPTSGTKDDNAAIVQAYSFNAFSSTDKQTLTLTFPGGETCSATSTRTLTNIEPDGNGSSHYTLTTTQPVVTAPN